MPGIGIGITRFLRRAFIASLGGGVVPSYDPDAQSYFDALPSVNTNAFKSIINDMIVDLKANGIFSEIDRFTFFAQEYQENAIYSITNPLSTPALEVSLPEWTERQGYKKGAGIGYINSKYNFSVDNVKYTKDSAMYGFWSNTDIDLPNGVDGGAQISSIGDNVFIFEKEIGSFYAGINDISGSGATPNIPVSDSLGFYAVVRTNATTVQLWKNGVLLKTSTINSTALPNLEGYDLTLNRSGSSTFPSSREQSFRIYGSGVIDQTNLYNILNTARTAVVSLPPAPPPPPFTAWTMDLLIPSLVDQSGNGYDSILGGSLPVGFTAPTVDVNNDIQFVGLQTIKLNNSLNISSLTRFTTAMVFETATPDVSNSLFQIGLQYVCGSRISVWDASGTRWAQSGGLFFNETASNTPPSYGYSLPKIQAGVNVILLSMSYTTVSIYCNGIVSHYETNPGASLADVSGWIGGYPGTTNNNYTVTSNIKLLHHATIGSVKYLNDVALSAMSLQSTGDKLMEDFGVSQIVYRGDSRTQGFTVDTNAHLWTSIITESLISGTAYKWAACNVGIGSRTMSSEADGCNSRNQIVPYVVSGNTKIDPILKSNASGAKNVSVIAYGINDFSVGRTSIQCQADLATLVAFDKSLGRTVFVMNVPGDVSANPSKEAERVSFNAALPALATSLGFTLLDICGLAGFEPQPAGVTTIYSDGVHFTTLANSMIASYASPIIIANI